MKKILLTGANGYVGQFVLRSLLKKEYIVHAVTSKSPHYKTTEKLFWHQADLLNARETEDLIKSICPTHLLHFAWYVEHGKFWNAIENLDWLHASLVLAKQFAENGGERMVTAGTCAEYDWTKTSPFSERRTDFRPQTFYGVTKNSLASVLEKFAQLSKFDFASGKIFFSFGANEPPSRLIPSVIRALLENKPAKTSHGNQIRDFLFVEDLADAFVALLESNVCGAVNIASGQGVRIRDIVQEIAKIIGNSELLEIGALSAPESEPLEIVADISRLREEVAFQKEHNLREKLEKTVNWWKENL